MQCYWYWWPLALLAFPALAEREGGGWILFSCPWLCFENYLKPKTNRIEPLLTNCGLAKLFLTDSSRIGIGRGGSESCSDGARCGGAARCKLSEYRPTLLSETADLSWPQWSEVQRSFCSILCICWSSHESLWCQGRWRMQRNHGASVCWRSGGLRRILGFISKEQVEQVEQVEQGHS